MTNRIIQADREAAAKVLGYSSWADATDYRLTGEQDRQVEAMVTAFAAHRLSCQPCACDPTGYAMCGYHLGQCQRVAP